MAVFFFFFLGGGTFLRDLLNIPLAETETAPCGVYAYTWSSATLVPSTEINQYNTSE